MEQPQVAAEAVFGKEVAPGTTPTREQELAVRLRDEVAKDVAPHQILEGMRPHPAPNAGEIHKINNENTGIKRKDKGPDVGEKSYVGESRSEGLRKRVDLSSRIAQEILDKGYDGLSNDPTGGTVREPKNIAEKQKILVDACMVAARAWPEGRAVLDNLSPADQKAKIEELFLKNPNALKLLSERFGEIYKGDGAVLNDILSEAQEEYEKAEKISRAKGEALTALKDRLKAIETGEKKFLPGTQEYNDLIKLRGTSSGWETLLRAKQNEIDQLTQIVNASYPKAEVHTFDEQDVTDPNTQKVLHKKTPVQFPNQGVITQIGQAEARMKALRTEMGLIQNDQGMLKGYEDEINRLNKERQDLKIAEAPLIEDSANAELETQRTKRRLDVARAARAVDEESFANSVEGMFQEAASKYMETEVKRYEAAQAKIAAKETANAHSADEKHIYKAMESKWREKNGKKRTKVNKGEVKAAYNQMLQERNVDWLVKQFMEQSILDIRNKTGVNGSPEEQEERKRLDEKYNDTDYMKRMGGIVSERLLRNYFEAGGKPEDGDIRVLTETDWGIAAIDNAITKNKEADDIILRLKGTSSGTKSEFIKGLMKNPTTYKIGVGLLAALFGLPFLWAGAGLAYGAYAAVGHASGVAGGPLF